MGTSAKVGTNRGENLYANSQFESVQSSCEAVIKQLIYFDFFETLITMV